MIRGHVFVVKEDTLPIHLKYQFIGTGAGGKDKNISLLSDMFRVKKGDYVFFYIEGNNDKKGRFLGVFKANDNNVYHLTGTGANQPSLPWYDNTKTKQKEPLKLIYRKHINPSKVYPCGVLEWMALDKLPKYASELLWMLIYRKMKGKRGNTMLFPWESERLLCMIADENCGQKIEHDGYDFDKNSFKIINGRKLNYNHGKIIKLNFNKRDITSETAFQAYIMQELNIMNNKYYPEIFGKKIVWIGNEVFAGAGMQKIDVLTMEEIEDNEYLYRIIELKYIKNNNLGDINKAHKQLEYYINWAREDIGGHLKNAKKYNIKPILLILDKTRNGVLSKSFPDKVKCKIKNLNDIASNPEIWVIDFNGNTTKII